MRGERVLAAMGSALGRFVAGWCAHPTVMAIGCAAPIGVPIRPALIEN